MGNEVFKGTSREDLAWAAGLFEGEGCFSTRHYSRDRSLLAKIKMSDEAVVSKFHKVIKVGNVTGPYLALKKKPVWIWQVGSFEGVQHTISSLWNWLGTRRRTRAKELINLYHNRGANASKLREAI